VKNVKQKCMEAFKHLGHKTPKKSLLWVFIAVIVFLLALIISIAYLFKNEKSFVVVKLYGHDPAINLSKNYNFAFFSSLRNNKQSMLAEEGDVLVYNNTFIHFTNTENDSMHVDDSGDSLVFVNGKINTIVVDNKNHNEELLPWFREMKPSDLSNLGAIYFESKIPDNYVPYLKEIGQLKPNTTIYVGDDDSVNMQESYNKLADFFSPRFVMASMKQKQLPLLGRWKNAECLYLEITDSVITELLPALPALKQCIFYGDDIKKIDASFFSKNKQLEKLTLICKLKNDSLLQPLRNLEELTINNKDDTTDLSAIKGKFNNLTVLIVSGTAANIESLGALKSLRWLGLPANATQVQFNNLSAQLPDLEVLELTGSDSIRNLAPLQQFPSLKGLVITDTVIDKTSLFALKKLRYLSLPEGNLKDSVYLPALEKALPGCIIVPNTGACLGSGWLLLLAPAVILLSLIYYKTKHNSDHISSQ